LHASGYFHGKKNEVRSSVGSITGAWRGEKILRKGRERASERGKRIFVKKGEGAVGCGPRVKWKKMNPLTKKPK